MEAKLCTKSVFTQSSAATCFKDSSGDAQRKPSPTCNHHPVQCGVLLLPGQLSHQGPEVGAELISLTLKMQQRMCFKYFNFKFDIPKTIMVHFYSAVSEIILTSSLTTWYTSSFAGDKRRLQHIICATEKVIGDLLSFETFYSWGIKDCGWSIPSWTQLLAGACRQSQPYCKKSF